MILLAGRRLLASKLEPLAYKSFSTSTCRKVSKPNESNHIAAEEEDDDYSHIVMERDHPQNEAAVIAHRVPHLRKFEIHTWGFAIYRCTYDSNSEWDRFMERLDSCAKVSLRALDHPELYDTLEWNVHSDAGALDGVSQDITRTHFKTSVERELASRRLDAKTPQTLKTCKSPSLRASSRRLWAG